MTNKQDILDRIKKLLALASNEAASPNEAEVSLKMAMKLQKLHAISDDDLKSFITQDENTNINIDVGAIREKIIIETNRITTWDNWIAIAASIASNCRIYTSRAKGGIVAYGLPVDLEVCQEFVNYLESVSDRLRRKYCAENVIAFGSYSSKAWKDGFCQGAISAARNGLEEAKKEQENEKLQIASATGALIVVDQRSLEVARNRALMQFKQFKGLVRTNRTITTKSGSSYGAGFNTGASQKFNRNGLN